MRRWLYALPLAAVAVCFILAGMVKNTVVHFDPGAIQEYMTSPSDFKESYRIEMELDETGGIENDIDPVSAPRPQYLLTAEELLEKSQVAVKAACTGERRVHGETLYTLVEIKEVYKGEDNLKGKQIWVVGDYSVSAEYQYINTSGEKKLPLISGQEYLLFLNKAEFHPARSLTEFQESQYTFATHTPADAFLFTEKKKTTVFEYEDGSSEWETLKTLRGIDVFTWDPEDLEEYYTLRDELYAQLNIQF